MPNIASILKAEIARVARKEVRRETAALKQASATHRREVSALKRRATELERHLREIRKDVRPPAGAANDGSIPEGARFSAKSLSSHRKRLGLSAADLGLLMGTSTQSIYNWEGGKARPQAKYLPVLVALRRVGKRRTLARLEAVKNAA
jgi:DNA-binding XRE family transcriptional regulator